MAVYLRALRCILVLALAFSISAGCAEKPLLPSWEQLSYELPEEYTLHRPLQQAWPGMCKYVSDNQELRLIERNDYAHTLTWSEPAIDFFDKPISDTRLIVTTWLRDNNETSALRMRMMLFNEANKSIRPFRGQRHWVEKRILGRLVAATKLPTKRGAPVERRSSP